MLQYDFVAVHCTKSQLSLTERLELVNLITANGWREDGCIRHLTNHSLNSVTMETHSPGQSRGYELGRGQGLRKRIVEKGKEAYVVL